MPAFSSLARGIGGEHGGVGSPAGGGDEGGEVFDDGGGITAIIDVQTNEVGGNDRGCHRKILSRYVFVG
ncbi:hypothetical protein J2S56_000728 [Corynebacterium lowii]|nr:hypothetical protein [Corynebacterium lowii]